MELPKAGIIPRAGAHTDHPPHQPDPSLERHLEIWHMEFSRAEAFLPLAELSLPPSPVIPGPSSRELLPAQQEQRLLLGLNERVHG